VADQCPTCHRPRFSDRHLAQVTRERDEARAAASSATGRADALDAYTRELAAKVVARDKRITELEAAEGKLVGYAVVTDHPGVGGRWVQTAPTDALDTARARARVYTELDARVVELREVGDQLPDQSSTQTGSTAGQAAE